MQKRQLGKSGLEVSALGLGCMGMSFGYPNWWGTTPMAVATMLESHDFSGKTIIPFCTHEGSALGQSTRDIAKWSPKSTLQTGLAIRGRSVKSAKPDVEKWLRQLGKIK